MIEYRDGANPECNKQPMPGMRKYSNITMKRGVFAANSEFFDWWNSVKLGKIERRDLTISRPSRTS